MRMDLQAWGEEEEEEVVQCGGRRLH